MPQQTTFAKWMIVFNYYLNIQIMNIYKEIRVTFSVLFFFPWQYLVQGLTLMWFELTWNSYFLWVDKMENWVDFRRVFLQMKIYYLGRLSLQNEILFFIITWTYRYMKNSESVSCSAIVGNRRCRRNCRHICVQIMVTWDNQDPWDNTDNQICL